MLVAELVEGFYVDSFLTSVFAAVCISLFSILTQIAIGKTGASVIVQRRKNTTKEKGRNTSSFNDETIIDVEVKEKNKK